MGDFLIFGIFKKSRIFWEKIPKIPENLKILPDWQTRGNGEPNIVYSLEFIGPHLQTKFLENPRISPPFMVVF